MSTFHEKYQGNFIHIADFKKYFKKKRKTILFSGIIGFFFTFTLLFSTNPKYVLKGSFKEALPKSESFSTSLAKTLIKGSSSSDLGAQAQSVMLSRELLVDIVDQLALQGEFKPPSMIKNLSERWMKNTSLLFKDRIDSTPPISFVKVMYLGNTPKVLYLEVIDDDKIKVSEGDGKVLSIQSLREMFILKDVMFSLCACRERIATGSVFKLVFYPLELAIDKLLKNLTVKVRRDDVSILDISYKDENSHRGAKVLNTLMHNYKQYLVKESERIATAQLQYLSARQDYLSDKIEETLKEHVTYLQKNLGEKGFLGLHQELEMVEAKKRRHHDRILEIDLNLGKLKRLRSEKLFCLHEPTLGRDVESFQNALLTLKKQKDSIDLYNLLRIASVRKQKTNGKRRPFLKTKNSNSSLLYYKNQLETMDDEKLTLESGDILPAFAMLKKGLLELSRARASSEMREPITVGFDNKRKEMQNILDLRKKIDLLLKEDAEKMLRIHQADCSDGLDGREFSCKEKFPLLQDALFRINHLLDLKESVLHKSFFAEIEIPEEFATIDLDSAKKLCIDYTKELDEVTLYEKHLKYSLHNISKKDFEVSSLTNILKDPISTEILNRCAKLSLELKDKKHLSEKDIQRLQGMLSREKISLGAHIKEMIPLKGMQKDLIEQKLKVLQSVMADLVNQEIAILEDQIDHAIDEKLQSLALEKKHVSAKLKDLQNEMKDLPSKWLLENRLQLKSDLNVSMMESLTQLVESKNIEHHLLQIESKPIDHAYIPLKPRKLPVMLISAIGGIFGSLLTMGALAFRKTVANALPVSLEGLSFRDFKVAGTLSKEFDKVDFANLSEKDLQVLRALSNFALSKGSHVIGAVLGCRPSYLSALASLLAISKRKTILIEMFHTTKASRVGLLHFLLGTKRELPIQKKGDFHLLSLGENTNYTMELLTRKKFEELVVFLKTEYEVVLIGLDKTASSAEAKKLLQLSDKMLITLDEESLDDLYPYFEWEEKMGKNSCMYLSYE